MRRHSGEKSHVSHVAKPVLRERLKNPMRWKSPIALIENMLPIAMETQWVSQLGMDVQMEKPRRSATKAALIKASATARVLRRDGLNAS